MPWASVKLWKRQDIDRSGDRASGPPRAGEGQTDLKSWAGPVSSRDAGSQQSQNNLRSFRGSPFIPHSTSLVSLTGLGLLICDVVPTPLGWVAMVT